MYPSDSRYGLTVKTIRCVGHGFEMILQKRLGSITAFHTFYKPERSTHRLIPRMKTKPIKIILRMLFFPHVLSVRQQRCKCPRIRLVSIISVLCFHLKGSYIIQDKKTCPINLLHYFYGSPDWSTTIAFDSSPGGTHSTPLLPFRRTSGFQGNDHFYNSYPDFFRI